VEKEASPRANYTVLSSLKRIAQFLCSKKILRAIRFDLRPDYRSASYAFQEAAEAKSKGAQKIKSRVA
jgi:hypothetical protein